MIKIQWCLFDNDIDILLYTFWTTLVWIKILFLGPDTRDGRKSRLSFQTGAIFLSACQTSDYDEIERILSTDNKKIINYANSDGLTALHQASIDGNIKMIKYLLEKGADINVTGTDAL